MGKSTYTACAAILVGCVHCKLSEKAILGGAAGLCACSANQKAGLRSRDHNARVPIINVNSDHLNGGQ